MHVNKLEVYVMDDAVVWVADGEEVTAHDLIGRHIYRTVVTQGIPNLSWFKTLKGKAYVVELVEKQTAHITRSENAEI